MHDILPSNMNQYIKIIKKVEQLIIKWGIPHYVKKWSKPEIPIQEFKTYWQFYSFLLQFVRSYHDHSFIQSKYVIQQRSYTESSNTNAESSNTKIQYIERPMPNFKWDKINCIGRIIFYHFVHSENEDKDQKDYNRIIKLVRVVFKRWEKRNIAGLIIDLRNHTGGSMGPAIESLVDILGQTTLFAWSNEPVTHWDKKWLNLDHGIKSGQKFLTSNIKFTGPIAIIVSGNTSSAGEMVAASFVGRKNIKIFGDNVDHTSGDLSVNGTINITSDITLILTQLLVTTVDGKIHTKEYIDVDINTKRPIIDSKKWIKNMKYKI